MSISNIIRNGRLVYEGMSTHTLESDNGSLTIKAGDNAVQLDAVGDTLEMSGKKLVFKNDVQLDNQTVGSDMNMQGYRITNVSAPSDDNDAANRAYVDSRVDAVVDGLDMKESVYLATIDDIANNASVVSMAPDGVNMTLQLVAADTLTIDGVTMTSADNQKRILLKNQLFSSENGVYTVTISGTTATLTRTSDFINPNLSSGASVFVEHGNVNDNSGFCVTHPHGQVNVGVDSVTFTRFSGTGHITFDSPLQKNHDHVSLAQVPASKIADGSVSDAEFQALDGVTSGIQAQLDTKITASSADSLSNKTISGANNTLSDIGNTSLSAGIDAAKIADGSVSDAEFQKLNGTSGALVDISSTQALQNKYYGGFQATINITDATDTGLRVSSYNTGRSGSNPLVHIVGTNGYDSLHVNDGTAKFTRASDSSETAIHGGDITGAHKLESESGQNIEIETDQNVMLKPTGHTDNNSKQLKNMADPTDAQDAATKAYVDANESQYTAGTGLNLVAEEFSIDSTVATVSGSQTLTNKTIQHGDFLHGIRLNTEMTNNQGRPAVSGPSNAQGYLICTVPSAGNTGDDGFMRIQAGGGASATTASYIELSGYSQHVEMDQNMAFGVGGTERMRIRASDGKILLSNGTTISNVPNPTEDGQVANKAYVDGGEYIQAGTGILKVPLGGGGWNFRVDPATTLTTDDVQTITQKQIDTDQNTVTNISNADIKNGAAIDATKIHDGTVDNFDYGLLSGAHEGSGTTLLTDRNAVVGVINKHMESNTCLFIDNVDNTKKFGFDVSDVPTGTIRTVTVKDGNYDMVGHNNAQTLSNKTLDGTNTVADGALSSKVVLDDSTHTLTNKSMSYDQVTGLSAGAGLSYDTGVFAIDSSVTTNAGAQTLSNKAFSDNLDMSSNKIINLGLATADGDAASKAYVDSVAQGLHVKDSCRLATTQDLSSNASISGGAAYASNQITATLAASGVFTVDGVNMANADRILVKDQSTGLENGIYEVAIAGTSLTLSRTDDFDSADNVKSGSFTFVAEGSVNEHRGYSLTTDGAITVGTTALAFAQFSGMGHITAGTGLSKTGDTVDMDLKTNGGLAIESQQLALDLSHGNISGQLPATKVGSGLIDNTEFDFLNGVSSNIQTQLDSKITASSVDTLTNKTLTVPVIAQISNTGTLTLPTSTGTVALTSDIPTNNSGLTNGAGYITASSVDTLTNKSISADQIGNGDVNDIKLSYLNSVTSNVQTQLDAKFAAADVIDEDNMASNSATKVPTQQSVKAYVDAQDHTDTTYTAGTGLSLAAEQFSIDSTVATLTGAQTLTNKTLTAPVISQISNTGTLTLPTSTGTVALTSDIPTNNNQLTNGEGFITASSADTLTNKSISADQLTGLTSASVGLGNVQNLKVKLDATAAPGVSNDSGEGYAVGSRWIDVTNDKEYVCLDASSGAAVWTETTGAGGGGSYTAGMGLELNGSEFKISQPTADSVDLCDSLTGTGERNICIGANALSNNTSNAYDMVAVGHNTMRDANWAVFSTAIGSDALMYKVSGGNDTALGYAAGKFKQDATNNTNLSQCIALGYQSRCSDNFQCQLGQSGTTTYHYGLQARSDRRDKQNIRDTVLDLEFIKRIRAVDYQWNHRENYFDEQPDGSLKPVPNDGSRAGKRFHHGVIAQEVKEVMDSLGVDFAGYQDHTYKGTGTDVLTIGYEEFICPLIRSVQQLSGQVEGLSGQVEELQNQNKYLFKKVKQLEKEQAFDTESYKKSIL